MTNDRNARLLPRAIRNHIYSPHIQLGFFRGEARDAPAGMRVDLGFWQSPKAPKVRNISSLGEFLVGCLGQAPRKFVVTEWRLTQVPYKTFKGWRYLAHLVFWNGS